MLRYQGGKNVLNIVSNPRKFKVNVDGPHLTYLLSLLLLIAISNTYTAAVEIFSELTSWTWTQRECSYRLDHFMALKMKSYIPLCFFPKDSKELKSKKAFWFFLTSFILFLLVLIFSNKNWTHLSQHYNTYAWSWVTKLLWTPATSKVKSDKTGLQFRLESEAGSYMEVTCECYNIITFLSSSLN